MAIEQLKDENKSEIAELLASYWTERGMPAYDKTWAEEYLKEGHKKEIKKDEFFIFKKDNRVIGVVSLIINVSDVAEIRDLVIKKEFRGKGYGRELLQEIISIAQQRQARKLFALVFPEIEKMYAEAGFEKEGLLKNHFAEGEDLVIMSQFI